MTASDGKKYATDCYSQNDISDIVKEIPSKKTTEINKNDNLSAMIESQTDGTRIKRLLLQAMTDQIDDREIFMKGIDYSYYYEQED